MNARMPHRVVTMLGILLACAMSWAAPNRALATIQGVPGPSFNLTASAAYISTGDGQSLMAWGYGTTGSPMQYPGPTMIVTQGQTVTVTLANDLPVPVSMVFPGQAHVTASGGTTGALTQEAPAAGCATNCTVTYTFTATQPGTYLYHSGTHQAFEVEMGLVGALIVRPNTADPLHKAYDDPKACTDLVNSCFDREYLFLQTEMDPNIHLLIDIFMTSNLNVAEIIPAIDFSLYHPTFWFMNGRNAPDTLLGAGIPWLPYQPYNIVPRMHPGERVLMRVISAGRDLHPFHHHGNNAWIIARDGRLAQSAPGMGPDLAESNFTMTVASGGTADAIFEWTGKGLGWDVYGHAAGDPLEPHEHAADHGRPFPTTMPEQMSMTFGAHWGGSVYLGQTAALPTGQGGMNPTGAYHFMWHSHTEREMTNDDIFPGGMMTMMMVEAPSVPIE